MYKRETIRNRLRVTWSWSKNEFLNWMFKKLKRIALMWRIEFPITQCRHSSSDLAMSKEETCKIQRYRSQGLQRNARLYTARTPMHPHYIINFRVVINLFITSIFITQHLRNLLKKFFSVTTSKIKNNCLGAKIEKVWIENFQ